MNRGMLWVVERPEELAQRLAEESDEVLRQRLKMVYLMALEPTKRRVELAREVGVNRETVGRWVRRYEGGGLSWLLTQGRASGRGGTLPAEVKEGLQKEVEQGEESYVKLQKWVKEAYGLEVSYRVVRYEVGKYLEEQHAKAGEMSCGRGTAGPKEGLVGQN